MVPNQTNPSNEELRPSHGIGSVQPARRTGTQSGATQKLPVIRDEAVEPRRAAAAGGAGGAAGIRKGRTSASSRSGKQTRYQLLLALVLVLGAALLVGLVLLLIKVLKPPAVEKVVIHGGIEQIIVGETAEFSAEIYPKEAEAELRWSSSDPTVAEVDSKGRLTPHAGGECEITAEAGGKKSSFSLRVLAVTGVEIEDSPQMIREESGVRKLKLCTGDTAALSARVLPGELAGRTVSWSTSTTAVATVDENGVVEARFPGTCVITASADGKTDTVSVTVYAVTGVSILNPPKELLVGKTAQLSARIVPEEAAASPVTWTSSNPAAATVDENGLVTSVATGVTRISASAGSESDEFVLNTFVVSSLEIEDGPRELNAGETLQLTTRILPAESAGTPVIWTSSDPGIATVDGNGVVTPVTHGSCTFTVEADGKTDQVTLMIYAVTAITIDEGERNLIVGEQSRVSATVSPESAAGTTPVYWTSSDPTVAIVDSMGNLTPVSAGNCVITVEAGGRSDSATYRVYEITGVAIKDTDHQLYIGDEVSLEVSILPIQAERAKVTWRSSDPSVLTVDENGVIRTVGVGECTITASAGRKAGIANFNVLTVSDITLSGGMRDFCIDEYSYINAEIKPRQAADYPVTWESSDPTVATVDRYGKVTPVGPGSCRIIAKAETKSDYVIITVRKYNRTEKKVLGRWVSSMSSDDFLLPFFRTFTMTLNGDLTGDLAENGSYSGFTWSSASTQSDGIHFSVSGLGNASLVYNESSDTLTLYMTGALSSMTLVFHRD